MSRISTTVRQHYTEECEAAINKQINVELHASYVYMSMAYHFDRDDIAMKGLHDYFKKKSGKERDNAEMLMTYQNRRGGRIVLHDVKAPSFEWNTHIAALQDTLALEKSINDAVLAIVKLAAEKNDADLCTSLNSTLIKEEVDTIEEVGKLLTNAERCGNDLGVYLFDKNAMP